MKEANNFIHIPYAELHEESKRYENASRSALETKVPVFLRVECKSYNAMLGAAEKAYDINIDQIMKNTMLRLCEDIQGCVFGYVANGEIVAIITDYHRPRSVSWLNYDSQKICSEAASLATIYFSREMRNFISDFDTKDNNDNKNDMLSVYKNIEYYGARFSATCFNVPENRVCDMIYCQQLSARRTIIQSIGRHYFSHNEMIGKSNSETLTMLDGVGIDWNELPDLVKNGACCSKGVNPFAKKSRWCIDENVPMLCGESAYYLQKIMDSVRDPEYYTEC